MSSQSREVRLRQQEQFNTKLETRIASLTARGLEPKAIDRDPTVRELKADLRKARKRLAAIDAQEALAKAMVERKAAKAAQAAKEKKSKKGRNPKAKGGAAKEAKGKAKAKAKPKDGKAKAKAKGK